MHYRLEEYYWGASTRLTLLNCEMVSSDCWRCALTNPGGVNASHCSHNRPSVFMHPVGNGRAQSNTDPAQT